MGDSPRVAGSDTVRTPADPGVTNSPVGRCRPAGCGKGHPPTVSMRRFARARPVVFCSRRL